MVISGFSEEEQNDFREQLTDYVRLYAFLAPKDPDHPRQDGLRGELPAESRASIPQVEGD
jgi:hypothetical protein